MREGYQGTGPGAIAPDGTSIDLYLRLPAGHETDIVAAAAPPGAHILDLGSGLGRITNPLLERGFRVTAVDESAEMLEHVRGARTVCSPIEALDLDDRFDVVLLASFLVNAGDEKVRHGLLSTCARHVADDGFVLIEREGEEDFFANVPREWAAPGGYTGRVLSAEPLGDGVRRVHVQYEFPDVSWSRTFLSQRLLKKEFEEELGRTGLRVDQYLTEDEVWVRAVKADTRGSHDAPGTGGTAGLWSQN
ncbi:class I SAM-dependent methyltransferase [Streptomyces sp. NBC_01217]|uniref:class I SAM-dependent methyltransferase n=1 Tax=Streptomyces sp. NBC_01217 TaxID=2903779 RepID=UPI002E11976C|nr:class I SAM-dependent methyltransferase [Streptomyces sp. NBC_01217]